MEKKEKNSMLFYSDFGVTVNLTRNTRQKIVWCVTFQRVRTYYNAGVDLSEEEWKAYLKGSKATKIKEFSKSVKTYFDNTMYIHVKDLAQSGMLSFELLNMRLSKSIGTDLKQSFRTKIQSLIADEKIGNANVYQCTLKSIDSYNPKKLQITDITPKWLENYEKYMLENDRSYSTIGMYMRTLRAIINEAKASNIVTDALYPFGKKRFGKYEIPIGNSRELALQPSEIKLLAEYVCPSKTIEMVRDLWLFSFLGNGANFGDILRFKYSDIKNNEIHFIRKKTEGTSIRKIEIIVPILPIMQNIMDKWANTPDSKSFIFPFLNGCSTEAEYKHEIHNFIRLTNKNIKRVTKELGLPDISTYWCRHSYTTILAKARVPESYIAEAVGHADRSITRGYIGKYNKEERLTYNSILLW